jgi:hypothetical protein
MAIDNRLTLHGRPWEPTPFEYDMTVLPGDLTKENFHDTSALFGSSLEGVMKYQQKSDPNLQLDVPRIVTVLIQAVEDKGGFNAEGIFRISASLTDLQDLKKQVCANSSYIDYIHVHHCNDNMLVLL